MMVVREEEKEKEGSRERRKKRGRRELLSFISFVGGGERSKSFSSGELLYINNVSYCCPSLCFFQRRPEVVEGLSTPCMWDNTSPVSKFLFWSPNALLWSLQSTTSQWRKN